MNGFTGLELTASLTCAAVLIPFLAALDEPGKVGKAYRGAMKKLLYFSVALVTFPVGKMVKVAVKLYAPGSFYAERINYQGRHFLAAGTA